jgi:hypothetical protein
MLHSRSFLTPQDKNSLFSISAQRLDRAETVDCRTAELLDRGHRGQLSRRAQQWSHHNHALHCQLFYLAESEMSLKTNASNYLQLQEQHHTAPI